MGRLKLHTISKNGARMRWEGHVARMGKVKLSVKLSLCLYKLSTKP